MRHEGHKKHADIARPALGEFHRQEWAIIGTPCGKIKKLAFAITEQLADRFRIGYVDADHRGADEEAAKGRDALANGAYREYTDKITFHRLDFKGKAGKFQYRSWFNDEDAVLVNGNHFHAQRQIVVIDPKKEDSLRRKLDRLTNVQLILLADGVEGIYPFLLDHLGEQHASVPVKKLSDVDSIAEWLIQQLMMARPPLFGLVLAGGMSTRMGRDKGLIDYHGKAQRDHAADLLANFCEQTFISCRPDQVGDINGPYPALPDTFSELGPFGAILSAFRAYPDHAWLVIATDLPLLDEATLAQLTAHRNPSRIATAFISPVNEFPEPLIAIWEPRSYPVLLQFLAQGYSCPRKTLINSDVELIQAANPEALVNVNHPGELEEVRAKLQKG